MVRRLSVLVVIGLLGARISSADGPHASPAGTIFSPAAGERLEAGSHRNITWRFGPEVEEAKPDEMELVLSVDGGASFAVRVTASLDPGRSGWEWRVPALPTEHARLLLRTGIDERTESERGAALSAEFAIVTSCQLPLEELFSVGGELRTREALETDAFPSTFRTSNDSQLASPERGEAAALTGRNVASTVRLPTFVSPVSATASGNPTKPPELTSGPPVRVHLRE